MRQFFHFKIKEFSVQKAFLFFLIFATSCAAHKKAQIREEKISKVIAAGIINQHINAYALVL